MYKFHLYLKKHLHSKGKNKFNGKNKKKYYCEPSNLYGKFLNYAMLLGL